MKAGQNVRYESKRKATIPGEFCARHQVDYYGTVGCPPCILAERIKLKRVRRAYRAIENWVRIDRMPKEHPLQQLRRALGKR